MADTVTRKTRKNRKRFVEGVEHKKRREDGLELLALFREWTGMEP